MADYIRCKNCDPIYCNGCNIKILEMMLDEGKFDCLMNVNRSINQSADVAPVVHARWDDSGRYTFPGGSTAVRCTECGCALTVSEFRLNRWNYCPVCGAKMDGSEIGETN